MNYKEITGTIMLYGGVALVVWLVFGYHIKRLPYKIRYARKKMFRTFGICPKCKTKMSRTGTGRWICTVDSCK